MASQLSGLILLVVAMAAFNNYRRGTLGDWFQAKFLGNASSGGELALVTSDFGAEGGAFSRLGGMVAGLGGQVASSIQGAGTPADLDTWRGATLSRSAMASYKAMVNAAAADGVSLVPTSTYRSNAAQIALRAAHGCAGRIHDPSCRGEPPTAVPGSSLHEQGLAVDFANTRTRQTRTYIWLAANAGRFGWKNLPSEPWHWSTGPRAGS